VRYWDASALLPILIEEPGTELVRDALREDGEICTWGLTRVELASAIERRARQGRISPSERRALLHDADDLVSQCHEVIDLIAIRRRAAALLARHALRAADAVQLAAALSVADPDPDSLGFVCLDRRLADAASREGMRVIGWLE
jgi:predicted nucleic acid-binding protein